MRERAICVIWNESRLLERSQQQRSSCIHTLLFKQGLFKGPLNGQLKSKRLSNSETFLKHLERSGEEWMDDWGWNGGMERSGGLGVEWRVWGEKRRVLYVLMHLKWSAVWAHPCLLFHYGIVTQGPVCSSNTINKVSAAHQYCYLHSVLIWSPYNHKMLIAPINSQSVCALVWLPGAQKVRVKMNCSLILLQEKLFSQDNTVFYQKSRGLTVFYHYYHSRWVAPNGLEIFWSDLSF